ncbi:MAG: hypothetical protein IH831_05100 [Planctomycetes bacterium]|nr:hypothetical protein [Planctomycetota bacterium]
MHRLSQRLSERARKGPSFALVFLSGWDYSRTFAAEQLVYVGRIDHRLVGDIKPLARIAQHRPQRTI